MIKLLKYWWWIFRVKLAMRKIVKKWCKEQGRESTSSGTIVFKLDKISAGIRVTKGNYWSRWTKWMGPYVRVVVNVLVLDARFGLIKDSHRLKIRLKDQRKIIASRNLLWRERDITSLMTPIVAKLREYGIDVIEDKPADKLEK